MYQHALKFHSQGSEFFAQAEIAYRELFQSEIFTYPESLSEIRWLELYGDVEAEDEDDDLTPEISGPTTSSDGTPSTLPQILYLAYKNYGLFRLDQLRHRLGRIEADLLESNLPPTGGDIISAATTGLEHLAEALGRDETDLELWRRISRVGEYLGSRRVARYCLEAVVENGDSGSYDQMDSLGLEERFATDQLKLLLPKILDNVSEAQLQCSTAQQKALSNALKRHVDPCPYLPAANQRSLEEITDHHAETIEITVPLKSWAATGKAILHYIHSIEQGIITPEPGSRYKLGVPSKKLDTPRGSYVSNPSQQPTLSNEKPNLSPVPVTIMPEHLTTNGYMQGLVDHIMQSPTETTIPIRNSSETINPENLSKTASLPGDQINPPMTRGPTTDGVIEGNLMEQTPAISTRKRSSDDAGLADSNETVRSRSKRIKARASVADPTSTNGESAEEWARWFAEQLQIYVQADEVAFEAVDNILVKLQCNVIGPFDRLKQALLYSPDKSPEDEPSSPDDVAIRALKQLLESWDLTKSRAFLNGNGLHDPGKSSQALGFSTYLEQSTRETHSTIQPTPLPDDWRIDEFTQSTQDEPHEGLSELAMHWLYQFFLPQDGDDDHQASFYESHLWPDTLKEIVVQMLVQLDEHITSSFNRPLLLETTKLIGLVQSIFELHLDIYGRITNPSSIVDDTTRTMQRDRLCRWASFASEVMNKPSLGDNAASNGLLIRFLWSTVTCNKLIEESSAEHIVECFHDLIRLLKQEAKAQKKEYIVIHLVNNALMPEISISAAEQEISRLTTMDFFTTIFSSNDEDPFTTIDSLEPLLRTSIDCDAPTDDHFSSPFGANERHAPESSTEPALSPTLREAHRFLNGASLSLRLCLWQKLRDAYSVINYPSMILSCNLQSLALIVEHLGSQSYVDLTRENDAESFLHLMYQIDTLMTQALALMLTDTNAFECIDNDHIRSLMNTLGSFSRIVHVFALWEDSIRVGQVQPPVQVSLTANKAQVKSTEKFRDMIVKTWCLQYLILREAMEQNKELFHAPSEDLLNYLNLAHGALGLRMYCSFANKTFLKLAKAEMLRMKSQEGWDADMPQIVFDLYGIKITSQTGDVQDHGCEPAEIDKATAFEVLDLILMHINRMSLKDLLKSELKFAVDKLQQVIKVPKLSTNTPARAFNRRLVTTYLKTPIKSVELFRSIRGIGELCSTPARTEGWEIAQRGWYFLLGNISLAKWRSYAQKRTGAGSTEDLENARVFFKLDLEFDTEKWETWYRLGQVYNALLEEYTTWTADKLDNDMAGLVELQRQAILSFNLALAIATRLAEPSFDTTSKIADLCADYGTRIYSSSREPFFMLAFSLQGFERHFNGEVKGMYKSEPFKSMHLYPAWKLSSVLLRKASAQKPNDWSTFYMLGKILWKMHSCSTEILNGVERIHHQPVVDALVAAIRCVPDKKDTRHPDKPPILEPHYKLLSVVHKLVMARTCTPQQGCRILKATQYARGVPDVHDLEEWVDYMQEVLRALRSADKSNWHHRMVARAAQTILETDPDDLRTFLGAKHELSQQMFTKAMSIQIWRPDNERPGRHFVYTGRYVRFFVGILYRLKDKDNMEALARRIRKRGGDFVNHAGVWEELSYAYLSVSSLMTSAIYIC